MRHAVQFCVVWVAMAAGSRPAPAQPAGDTAAQRLHEATQEAGRGDISSALVDIQAAIALDPLRADSWYELGSVLGQTGDFHSAETALRRAIALKPDLAKAHYGLALTLIGNPQGTMDWPGAIAECRAAIQDQLDYPEALDLLGAGLSATGQPDAAIPELQRAIQLSPAMAEAHFNLGAALEGTNRLDEAAQEYRVALAARSAYPEAASALGNLLARLGKTAEAEQQLVSALRLNPDLTSAHYALARLYRSLHRTSEAALEFSETKDLTDRPANGIQAAQWSNQALSVAAKGDLTGASSLLRKAIALKPDYAVPHYNLGLILADSGDAAGALGELSKAISLAPAQPKLWFDYGRVLRLLKDDRGALAAIRWAAKLSPSDPRIQAELASMHDSEAAAGALPVADPAAQKPDAGAATDSAAAHLTFALELMRHQDLQGAVGELLRALSLEPAGTQARRKLADLYERMGDRHHAILEDDKVLISAPDDAETRILLGKLLLADGDAAFAAKQLQIALEGRPHSSEARSLLQQAQKQLSKP